MTAFITSRTAGISWRQYVAIDLGTLKESGRGGAQCSMMTRYFCHSRVFVFFFFFFLK